VFIYNPQNNVYSVPEPEYILPSAAPKPPKLILDFGDVFFLDTYLRNEKLDCCLDALAYRNRDTIYAMLCYYILCTAANCYAEDWYYGSYASVLYPKANLVSQRISEFLSDIGQETSLRNFFSEYIFYISNTVKKGSNILIDSTGLPNSIHFPLTAVSNHNGEINNEVRLIYVTEQETGLPIYFRYCPGNIIDVSTLSSTILELKENGVNTKFAILDAGYYSEDNIITLYKNKVSFVTRLKENLKIHKELAAKYLPTIEDKSNFVSYNSRYVFLKRVERELVPGYRAYAYIGLDIDRKSSEAKKLFRRAKGKKLSDAEVYDRIKSHETFILVSSRRIAIDKILPTYYTRQHVEQIFDIGKNYAGMLPLRVQNEDTFRGHLLMTFIGTVIVRKLQEALIDSAYNPISVFMNLRNQKCKVYSEHVVVQEAARKANDIYKLFKIVCPTDIKKSKCR
jgi:hypothetical protein